MTQSRIPATHLYQVLDVLCITLKNFFMEYIVDLQCCVNFSCTTNWISYAWVHAKLLQSCLTLCDLVDYSLPGSSVHEILQARILEWELPFPPPEVLLNPGIKLRAPTLQAVLFLSCSIEQLDTITDLFLHLYCVEPNSAAGLSTDWSVSWKYWDGSTET